MPELRDTRGVGRALSGNIAGAIEDFEVFVDGDKPASSNRAGCVGSKSSERVRIHLVAKRSNTCVGRMICLNPATYRWAVSLEHSRRTFTRFHVN